MVNRKCRKPCRRLGFASMLHPGNNRRQAVMNRRIAAAPTRRDIGQGRRNGVGRVPGKTSHHLFGAHFPLKLIAHAKGFPGAHRGLVQSLRSGPFDLGMNRHGGNRLHRSGISKVLAKTEHGFDRRVGTGIEVDAGQQFTAVRGRILHLGRNPLAILSERALAPRRGETGLEPGRSAFLRKPPPAGRLQATATVAGSLPSAGSISNRLAGHPLREVPPVATASPRRGYSGSD